MLAPNLDAVAREILNQNSWDTDKALVHFIARLETDKALSGAVIHEAASSIIRSVAAQQRAKFHRMGNRSAGVDDTKGLAIIAHERYMDTYLLLNDIRLGDARHADLQAFLEHHQATIRSSQQRAMFAKHVLSDKKFKPGKRVRDCFTEMDLARIAGELKC